MGPLGNILSTAVNIINVPLEVLDKVILEEDGCFASPLREVSKIVGKVDE